jgi:hypothetical protein
MAIDPCCVTGRVPAVENLTLTGSSAVNGTGNAIANVLSGNSGNNTLAGNAGADVLNGAAGTAAASDLLAFSDLTYGQVTLAQSGNDLLITRNGVGTDSVRVTNWFTVSDNEIENVQFTDQTLISDDINTLLGGNGLRMSAPMPDLERSYLGLLGDMGGFRSTQSLSGADWDTRLGDEATMELAMNSVEGQMAGGGGGRRTLGGSIHQQV